MVWEVAERSCSHSSIRATIAHRGGRGVASLLRWIIQGILEKLVCTHWHHSVHNSVTLSFPQSGGDPSNSSLAKARAPRALRAKVGGDSDGTGGEIVVGLCLTKRDSERVVMQLTT